MWGKVRSLLFLVSLLHQPALAAPDLFAPIEVVKLANGIPVYLDRDPRLGVAHVEVRVFSGWSAEEAPDLGAAHLVEHALFRPRFGDALMYSVRQRGGEVNGNTTPHFTNYFGTIRAADAAWLLEKLGAVVAPRLLNASQIEKARREVELELGRSPGELDRAQWDSAWLAPLFGLKIADPKNREVAASSRVLPAQRVRDFFHHHYRADNIAVLAAGNFDRAAILAAAHEWFDDYPAGPEPLARARPVPLPKPFVYDGHAPSADQLSVIELGTRFWAPSPEDEVALFVYVNYLSYRVEKTLREDSGSVYAVRPVFRKLPGNCGTATIHFSSSPEDFEGHRSLAYSLLARHASGAITDGELEEAKRLFEADYRGASETGLSGLIGLVRTLADFRFDHGSGTPSEALARLSPAELRGRITRLFSLERRYAVFWGPALPAAISAQGERETR